MKNKYMSIIVMSLVVGIFMGIIIKEDIEREKSHVSKDYIAKKEIKSTSKRIDSLKKEKEEAEEILKELQNEKSIDYEMDKLENLKKGLSYTDVKESGIIIEIDALNEEVGNIANSIEYNKILINIINNLKINGARFISINDERLNQYSEVVLAGNHINVNSSPIAPPYKIKVIGEIKQLSNYIEDKSNYIYQLGKEYPLKINMKVSNNIAMDRKSISNEFDYVEGD